MKSPPPCRRGAPDRRATGPEAPEATARGRVVSRKMPAPMTTTPSTPRRIAWLATPRTTTSSPTTIATSADGAKVYVGSAGSPGQSAGIVTLNNTVLGQALPPPARQTTSFDGIESLAVSLGAGADDYVVKPFHIEELLARVRALLRRTQPDTPQTMSNGPLSIDISAAEAKVGPRRLNLTRREFDLLAFMTQNVGRVYSRTELLDRVWGADFLGGERTVDQHITQLRAHLEDEPSHPAFLETVRGKGYRMRAWAEGV